MRLRAGSNLRPADNLCTVNGVRKFTFAQETSAGDASLRQGDNTRDVEPFTLRLNARLVVF